MANATEQRLIDANELLLQNELAKNRSPVFRSYAKVLIDNAPTIDAELVVHGRWIRQGNKNECDQCGFFYYSTRADYRRCPMCEAKMDLKEHQP